MKKITLFAVALLISTLSYSQAGNYNVGDIVNDFTVTDTDGVEHNLYSITAEGKYVFLDFFFDTCPPCQTTTPLFNEFYDKYGCNEGVIYCLSVNNGSDSNAEVIAFKEQYGGPFNHAPAASAEGGSGAVDADFGIVAYPTFVLINPNNEIINTDIWPISGVSTFENALPAGVDPQPMACTLSVDELVFMDSITVYPNPVTSQGNLTITLPEAIPADIVIYNTLGQQVYQEAFDTANISLPINLGTGMYVVKVVTAYGTTNQSIIVR